MLKKSKSDEFLQHIHQQQMTQFHQLVESQVDDGMDYLEAIIAVCEEYGIEVEECLPLLSNKLLSELQRVCAAKNLIKGDSESVDLTEELFST